METYDYETAGGKNLILDFIDDLPKNERLELYDIRRETRENGIDAFEKLGVQACLRLPIKKPLQVYCQQ